MSDLGILEKFTRDNPLKVAFIGVGKNALEHLRAFESLGPQNVEIVGFWTRDIKKAMRLCNITEEKKFFTDFSDLEKKAKPDLVVISVPVFAALEVFQAASSFDWDILIEKPLGKNLEESRKILSLVEGKKENSYFVGLNRRFLPASLAVAEVLKLQQLDGRSRIIISVKDRQSRFEARELGHQSSVIDNWHFANSIHVLDLGISYLKLFEHQEFKVDIDRRDYKDLMRATINSPKLGILNYESIWETRGYWGISIHTENWWINQAPLENLICSKEVEPKISSLMAKYLENEDLKPGYQNQARALASLGGDLRSRLVSLNEGNFSMTLIDRVFNE